MTLIVTLNLLFAALVDDFDRRGLKVCAYCNEDCDLARLVAMASSVIVLKQA